MGKYKEHIKKAFEVDKSLTNADLCDTIKFLKGALSTERALYDSDVFLDVEELIKDIDEILNERGDSDEEWVDL